MKKVIPIMIAAIVILAASTAVLGFKCRETDVDFAGETVLVNDEETAAAIAKAIINNENIEFTVNDIGDYWEIVQDNEDIVWCDGLAMYIRKVDGAVVSYVCGDMSLESGACSKRDWRHLKKSLWQYFGSK